MAIEIDYIEGVEAPIAFDIPQPDKVSLGEKVDAKGFGETRKLSPFGGAMSLLKPVFPLIVGITIYQ